MEFFDDIDNLAEPFWDIGGPKTTPKYNLTQFSLHYLAGIVSCANTCHLFCVPTVRMEDMDALFACKEGFRIRVNNIRHVAVLFDALLERSYIQAYWQSVLERGKFLVSKDGKRIVTASSLSTALSAARIRPTSVVYAIRTMIGRLP